MLLQENDVEHSFYYEPLANLPATPGWAILQKQLSKIQSKIAVSRSCQILFQLSHCPISVEIRCFCILQDGQRRRSLPWFSLWATKVIAAQLLLWDVITSSVHPPVLSETNHKVALALNWRHSVVSWHRWFSGRMLACHAGGPGSIPGRCNLNIFTMYELFSHITTDIRMISLTFTL